MDRLSRSSAVVLGLCVVAGCQSPRPPAPTPLPPATVPTPVPPQAAASPANSRADAAARLAASQAKSIDELLAARSADDRAVAVIEPPHAAAPPAAPPAPTAAKPADPSPTPAGGAADTFRAVPSIGDYHPPAPVESAPMAAEPVPLPPPPPRSVAAPSPPRSDDPLAARLDRTAGEHPRDLAAQLDAQLYKLSADQPVPTPEALAGLTPEDRNVLGTILDGLTNFRTGVRNDADQLIGDKIAPVLDMAERLRAHADLRIVNATLVRRAPAFGNYDPIAPATIVNGSDARIGLYYEIENVNATLDAKGFWTTAMTQDVVLYDRIGRPVWKLMNSPVNDACRSRRRDFFVTRALPLPHTLAAGKYRLMVTLTDPSARRMSEKGLTLTYADASPATDVK